MCMCNEIKESWCLITPNRAKMQDARIETIQNCQIQESRTKSQTINALLKKWGMVSNN